jgi:outer membrane protein OmpA-like peptidoglycan-associated protein
MNMRIDPFKLALCLLLSCGPLTQVDAQLWKRLQDQVKNTAEDHVVNDAGNATDKAIDKAEDGAGKKVKGKKGKSDDPSKDDPSEGPDAGSSTTDGSAATAPAYTIKAYQNYDFVPGDTVLFFDDFADDMSGEFPSHWNLTKGQAVVNTIAGKPAFCLTEGNYVHVLPRMKKIPYLTDPFTIEFDMYTDGEGNENPILFLTYQSDADYTSDGEVTFARGDDEGRGEVSTSNFPGNGFNAPLPAALATGYPNKWHHCAVIYKAGQLKCYVDQYRILVVPDLGCVPISFGFEGIGDQDHPIVITNVRAASGGSMNMVGKKFTDAKIVTHGINFDVDKATIKPESMGTLNMIVKVLNDNPDLKFEIDGHTDNTGDAAHNLTLSQERAASVAAQLESMGINASRLSTKGYGDTRPLVGNDTPEGRANNRRVEFVRM